LKPIRKTIKLHPIQYRFHHSKALYRGFVGGRGAGKSWIGAYDLITRSKRDCTYLIASPTSGDLYDTTLPTFKSIAMDLGVWDFNSYRQTPHPSITLTNGARVRFRSADNPDRLRGANLSGVWLDEASMMEHDAYLIALGCLREHNRLGWLTATFTPQGLTHWTFAQFGKSLSDTEIFTAPMRANPFIPKQMQQQLTEQYGLRGILAQQELEGKFVSAEGAEWPADYFDNILYDHFPLKEDDIFCRILALDPSMGKNAKSGDYSALLYIVADRNYHMWVQDSTILRMTTNQCEDTVVHYINQFKPDIIPIECNGFQDVLASNILLKSPSAPVWKYINKMDKEVRLRMILTPYLAHRRLHIRNTPHNQLLLAQLRDFPEAEHDDAPDALSLGAMGFADLVGKLQQKPSMKRERLQVS